MFFDLSVLNRVYNFTRVCHKRGIVVVKYGLDRRRMLVFKTGLSCVKQESVYFVIVPKQGPKVEGVVLNRVGILGLFLNKVRVSDPQRHSYTQT